MISNRQKYICPFLIAKSQRNFLDLQTKKVSYRILLYELKKEKKEERKENDKLNILMTWKEI